MALIDGPDGPRPAAPEPPVRLPCGRDPVEVWDRAQTAELSDAHARTCPHCAAVVAQSRAVAGATDEWRARPASAPAVLIERTMTSLAAEVQQRFTPTIDTDHGPVKVPDAAARIRRRVDSVAGATARSCRLTPATTPPATPLPTPGASPGGAGLGRAVDVALSFAVDLGRPIPDITDRVRRAVEEAVAALGAAVGRVDLLVADLLDDAPGT